MAVAKLTSTACRAARGILKWTVRDLAREAAVSPTTVNLLEADRPHREGTAAKFVAAFRRHGVEITNGEGTGARLLFQYAYACERDDGSWGVFAKLEEGAPGLVMNIPRAIELAEEVTKLGDVRMADELRAAIRDAASRT